ncbi:MAG: ACR3 family arsenite efflux transporter [Planctomycetes bacterium]|nr:ACR3 family arsenite efflux transporter [Planctomycetota bacterium]
MTEEQEGRQVEENEDLEEREEKALGIFERYLTLWVALCIVAGILIGRIAPRLAGFLDSLSITVQGAPIISVPIAICLFLMIYPIMVKIDFGEVIRAGKNVKPVLLTLFVNWAIKPFSMALIATVFLGSIFVGFIGQDTMEYVRVPLGMDDPVGAEIGDGRIALYDMENEKEVDPEAINYSEGDELPDGITRRLAVRQWRSYLAGAILLGIAPCTAMVFVWSYLAKGSGGLTLVMVAINSLTMLVLYGPLGGFLLGVGRLPVPWRALLLSIFVYVALPLVAGYFSRKWIIATKGKEWFEEKFLHLLTPITMAALLLTLVFIFVLQGDRIVRAPQAILLIAIPLFIQTNVIFWLGYGLAKLLKLDYEDAAPAAMIGASNHFEVALATAAMLFGLQSGAALATVVGVLIEVPVMLMLVKICLHTTSWFPRNPAKTQRPVT